jgi:hypothetical protein
LVTPTSAIGDSRPELQLLFKRKGPRSKDDIDAAEVIPSLDARQRGLLSRLLESNDAWLHQLA